MKHLQTFESFNQIDEVWGQKFFTGHANTEEKNAARTKIEADIDAAIAKMTLNVDREKWKANLLDKAKNNNWKGSIVWGKDGQSGNSYPVYKNGESGLNATAAGLSAGTEVLSTY